MTNIYLNPDQLVVFHEGKVSRNTALNYVEEMENAKTLFVIVETINGVRGTGTLHQKKTKRLQHAV